MILDNEFPPDSRVEKEIQSLAEQKHEVVLACYTRENRPLLERKTNYLIIRKQIPDIIFTFKAASLPFPFYFNFWNRFIKSICISYTFDAVIAHDLPMARIANSLKKKYHLVSICDQHEYYSDWIVKTRHMNTLAGKIVKFFSNWKKFEKSELTECDLVLTVAEPLRENYKKEYNLPESKILTIPNTPTKRIFNNSNIKPAILQKYAHKNAIFYAGGLDALRGIDIAIKAMPTILNSYPNALLVLGGKLNHTYNPFKLADDLNIRDKIDFVGWINEEDLPSYIAASSVCFFTPPANRDEINMTIATKIYQYALMRKPIIVGSASLMKNYVESNGLGVAIDESNADEFAEAAIKIITGDFKPESKHIGIYWEDTVMPLLNSNLLKNRH